MLTESLVNLRTHESLVNLPLNAPEDLARLLTEPMMAESLANLALPAPEDLARLLTESMLTESLVNLRTHESLVNLLPLNASEDLARPRLRQSPL